MARFSGGSSLALDRESSRGLGGIIKSGPIAIYLGKTPPPLLVDMAILMKERIGHRRRLAAAIPAVVIYNHFSRRVTAYRALVGDTSAAVLRLVSRDLGRR